MSSTIRALKRYVSGVLGLKTYLQAPGDGRRRGTIAAGTLLWAQLLGYILREVSYHGIERLVKRVGRRGLGVSRRFGDDALGYFTERLDPAATRAAAAVVLRRAKRNKAFQSNRFIGFALDGTGAGRSQKARCRLCRPYYNDKHEVVGYRHALCAISVVGVGLTLPFDVEPYGPGDCEYKAGQRLLRRAVRNLGRRFAQYVVVDGEFATAPFCIPPRMWGSMSSRGSKTTYPSYLRRPGPDSRRRRRHAFFAWAATASNYGMPTILIPGKRCVGPPCGSFAIGRLNPTAPCMKPIG